MSRAALTADTIVSVSANIAQQGTMTYAQLLERVGQDPQRAALIAALEAGKPYNLDGIDIRIR
jgi:hypothetical protein